MTGEPIHLVVNVDATIEIDGDDRRKCGFGCNHSTGHVWCELFGDSTASRAHGRRSRCDGCLKAAGGAE